MSDCKQYGREFAEEVERDAILQLAAQKKQTGLMNVKFTFPFSDFFMMSCHYQLPVSLSGARLARQLAQDFVSQVAAEAETRGEDFQPNRIDFLVIIPKD